MPVSGGADDGEVDDEEDFFSDKVFSSRRRFVSFHRLFLKSPPSFSFLFRETAGSHISRLGRLTDTEVLSGGLFFCFHLAISSLFFCKLMLQPPFLDVE